MTNIPSDANLLGFVGRAGVSSTSASSGTRGGGSSSGGSWYEAMSKAWGQTLDAQASRITSLSDQISAGGDQPSNMVALTAESLKMQFMSNNAATSQNSVAQALSEVAKKN